MESLSDKILVDAYFKATELTLQEDFVQLLREEIDRRRLTRLIT
ncbi:sporulation histidine kinase inhibitor Sda [Salicibibacter halophilus]|uniref:Sporulation histidine kinase inhibitor Sda n=1 Tax=Salicibibacter halophilus TaxID=2502791 RepID=A0A514LGD7_9BACI|nr:sporulation histidine kinase inhibitor Sda [Salicibibacter halophilus]